MLRVFDFECPNGHREERFVNNTADSTVCQACGEIAPRVMSAPRFQLEGITGAFPGAYHAWEKKRAEKQAIQARKERDHGDSGWT